MSTCISRYGEYDDHEPGDWCPSCGAFNEQAVVAERDALLAALRAVEKLHQSEHSCANPRHTNPDVGCPDCAVYCQTCGTTWPCRTRQALARTEELIAAARRRVHEPHLTIDNRLVLELCDALETARRDTLDEAQAAVEAVDIDPDCDCEVVTLRAATEALREMAGGQ